MTDRVTKVVLRGDVGDLLGKLKATSSAVKATAASMTDSSRESKVWRQNLTAVGTSAGKLGLVAAAGVGLAVRAFANFDQAMSEVAATGEDARNSMDELREAAIQAGARTQFSATEAAQAIEALAKAGVSAADILGGGLDGAMDLAAAGGLNVADAAEIAATAMNQFNLVGADVPHIADLLAAAAGKAMGDVTDMGQAFKFVGPVASQLGVSMEETAGSIALLAQNGVLGEQAGTSLRGMLSSLTSPSTIAKKTMDQLGLSMYDATGHFIGLEGVAGQLHDKLGDLGEAERDEALGRIFGNQQITAARILYAGGAEDVRKWTAAVDDSGYAAKTAATKMDNLKGDLEQLRGGLETALIGTGQGANGPLRDLVQMLTSLVNAYNALPGPIKTTILAGAGLTAGLGSTVFVVSKAINAYSNLKMNLDGLGTSFDKTKAKALAVRGGMLAVGVGLAKLSGPAHEANEQLGDLTDVASAAAMGWAVGGPWGAAIGGGIALISSLGGSSKSAAIDMEGLTKTLDEQTGAVTKNTAAWVAKSFQDSGVSGWAKALGISLDTLTDAALGNADAMQEIKAKTKDLPGWLRDSIAGPVEDMAGSLDAASEKQSELSETSGKAADGIADVGTAADAAADDVKNLQDALDSLLDPLLKQEDASNAWKDSLASLSEDVKKNAKTLDDNTKTGRANQDAIRDRVKALKESAQADLDATGNQEAFTNKLERGRTKLIDAAVAAGFSRQEVKKYIDQLGLTPDKIETVINADTADALEKLRRLQGFINGMHGKTVKVAVAGGTPGGQLANARGSITDYYADGGFGENHIAQIAPAGTTRVWNEPETGGEAYIPFAQSKRKRSQQIAMQTVDRLGGVAYFANGGTTGKAPTSGPVAVRLTSGALTIKNGQAYVEGIAELVNAGDNNYAGTNRRAGRS